MFKLEIFSFYSSYFIILCYIYHVLTIKRIFVNFGNDKPCPL